MIRPALICFGLFIVSWAVLMGCASDTVQWPYYQNEADKRDHYYQEAAERFDE